MVLSSRYKDDRVSFRALSKEQLKIRDQIDEKLREGEYAFKENPCLCGSKKAKLLAQKDCFGLPQKVFICEKCSLVYQDPIISEKNLLDLYAVNFRKLYHFHDMKDVYFQTQIKTGEQIIQSISKFMDIKGKRVLDVGCGSGGLLLPFNIGGADTLGIDLDEGFLAMGREKGLNVINKDLMTFSSDEKFDLITMTDTFEHLPNAKQILSKLRELLTDEGYLFIGVPNVDPHIPKFHFLHHLHILHMWYFDRKTLGNLLESQGFQVKNVCVERNLEILSQKKDEFIKEYKSNRKSDVVSKYVLLKFRCVREAIVLKVRGLLNKTRFV